MSKIKEKVLDESENVMNNTTGECKDCKPCGNCIYCKYADECNDSFIKNELKDKSE